MVIIAAVSFPFYIVTLFFLLEPWDVVVYYLYDEVFLVSLLPFAELRSVVSFVTRNLFNCISFLSISFSLFFDDNRLTEFLKLLLP